MTAPVGTTELGGLPLFRRGKVRDVYDLGDHLLIVASDRVSAFDVVLPTPIPGKGIVLTQLSRFWFEQTSGLVPNHLVSTDPNRFPESLRGHAARLAGRSMLVRKAERIDVECVVRGSLAGSAWAEYRASGTVAGEPLPSGLREGQRLSAPLFTPAVKHDDAHDVTVSPAALGGLVGARLARRLEEASRDLYEVAAELAARRGILIADTKFEFGLIDGDLVLIDELLTPDSSRFWDAEQVTFGGAPLSFDKQDLRDWLEGTDWDKRPPAPELPPEVVDKTVARYVEAYRRLTGSPLRLEAFGGEAMGGEAMKEAELARGKTGGAEAAPRWTAEVVVLPREGVSDPEGEAILGGLKGLGYAGVRSVRAGRLFRVELAARDHAEARAAAEEMCQRLLANPVIERYSLRLDEVPPEDDRASAAPKASR